MPFISQAEAHANAREILSHPNLSTEAIQHARDSVLAGRMIGRSFDRCFLGLLAEGSGYHFPAPVSMYSSEILDTVERFAKSIGVEVRYNQYHNPIEKFCSRISGGDTPENCEEARLVAEWLDDELTVRRKHQAMLAHVTEGAIQSASEIDSRELVGV